MKHISGYRLLKLNMIGFFCLISPNKWVAAEGPIRTLATSFTDICHHCSHPMSGPENVIPLQGWYFCTAVVLNNRWRLGQPQMASFSYSSTEQKVAEALKYVQCLFWMPFRALSMLFWWPKLSSVFSRSTLSCVIT
jgi:hypothetical protein